MSKKHCSNPTCGIEVIGAGKTIVVGYVASALALTVPFLNSAGATVKTTFSITGMDFSFMSVLIGGIWILSGLAASSERHTSVTLCIISSLGLPGLFLAVLAVTKF
jgi:hypothetical protein